MDCVPSDSQEGQPVEKTSFMAMASEAPNIHLTPLLGPESLEGNSRHGLKARDSGFLLETTSALSVCSPSLAR